MLHHSKMHWYHAPRWRRKWQPTPEFMNRESCGQRSLVGCSAWGSHRVGHDWIALASKQKASNAPHSHNTLKNHDLNQCKESNLKTSKPFHDLKKKTWQITLQGNYHLKVKVPDGPAVKNLPAKQEMQEAEVQSLDREDPQEDETSTYSTILD